MKSSSEDSFQCLVEVSKGTHSYELQIFMLPLEQRYFPWLKLSNNYVQYVESVTVECGIFFFFDYEKTKTMCPESHSVIEYNIHENVSIHEMAFTYEKYIFAYILLINDR